MFCKYIYYCEESCYVEIFCYFFNSYGFVEFLSEEIEVVKIVLFKVGYILILMSLNFLVRIVNKFYSMIYSGLYLMLLFVGDQYGGDREGVERVEIDLYSG